MNTRKFASVAVVLAALCLSFLLPYRAFAQVGGVEDGAKGVCIPTSAYAKCSADLATCQKSAKDLEESLKKCKEYAGIPASDPIPSAKPKPTETAKPSETAKPPPKATTAITATASATAVPTTAKPAFDAREEIDKLKKRVTDLETEMKKVKADLAKKGPASKLPDLDKLLKELEELQNDLIDVQKTLDELNKKLDRLLEEYAKLLIRVGRVEMITDGLRKKLCSAIPTNDDEVREFCGATQLTVDVSVHGVADFYNGAPAQHYGVEAKVSGTFFPGSGTTGFIAGAGFGMLWGTKWVEDREYRVSPFAGVEACTAQDRRTCFQVTGVFNIYTWAGRANDSQLPSKLRNKFETSFGWALGLGVGFKHHITEGLWFGLDVTPKVTPGKNSWSFSPAGSPVIIESKGFGIDAVVGLGGTFDLF